MARVLILGAGFGGISAAVTLRRLAPDVEVVLIDWRADFLMGLRKTWEVVGEATLVDGTRSLSALARHGITVRQGRVEHLDPANLRATIQGEQVGADAIVIALGAEHARRRYLGWSTTASTCGPARARRAPVRRSSASLGGGSRSASSARHTAARPDPSSWRSWRASVSGGAG